MGAENDFYEAFVEVFDDFDDLRKKRVMVRTFK